MQIGHCLHKRKTGLTTDGKNFSLHRVYNASSNKTPPPKTDYENSEQTYACSFSTRTSKHRGTVTCLSVDPNVIRGKELKILQAIGVVLLIPTKAPKLL